MHKTTSRRAAIIGLLLLSVASTAPARGEILLVTGVQAAQRDAGHLVDVTFDLQTIGDQPVLIQLFFSTDGGATFPYLCQTVSGDVGPGVLPGPSRHIVWDAGADLPGFSGATCRVRVVADDSPYLADFAYVPPGSFQMGSPPDEPGRSDNETLHPVTLSRGFYLAQHPVTEQLWDAVMGGGTSTSTLPQHDLSWDDAVAFCNALSLLEGLTPAYTIHGPWGNTTWDRSANGYRLPTEAEWEYACRAGTETAFASGPITYPDDCAPLDPNLDLMGWYCGNAGGVFHPVGQKQPNLWGLYDMHGSVHEWVWDGYRADYENLDPVDPAHDVGIGQPRVRRGGWRDSAPHACRSARRASGGAGYPGQDYGFRLARSVVPYDAGTIHLVPQPDGLDAPWQVDGPVGYTAAGSGEAVLASLAPGDYNVAWGAVSGWDTPAGASGELTPGAVLVFTGEYTEAAAPGGFVLIEPGAFLMGSPPDEPARNPDETLHPVTLTRGFYMAQHPVTRQWWDEVMGDGQETSQLAQNHISWDLAVQFCNALSLREGLTPAYTIDGPNGAVTWHHDADGYRLPTEAEWEYACRAGTVTAFSSGPIINADDACSPLDPNLDLVGWYCGNAFGEPHPVGSKQPNAWGLYDMHGNLWEWVWDGYRGDYENLAPVDPVHDVPPGVNRVLRGGFWHDYAHRCRSALRNSGPPTHDSFIHGLRPVRTVF